jgi:hypothetical protein
MARNKWTASIGIDGRHGPEHAPVDSLGSLIDEQEGRSR